MPNTSALAVWQPSANAVAKDAAKEIWHSKSNVNDSQSVQATAQIQHAKGNSSISSTEILGQHLAGGDENIIGGAEANEMDTISDDE